ncbi:phytanoyl-CoA dioxygenase family protein [Aestuariibius sp. 2305UL40-4]|uniref:phytanoyl-CoA dioxygenase family protein n=1 Tax=Aestuariibius violaceus TaxID=3234132 RepID=UPI00345F0640
MTDTVTETGRLWLRNALNADALAPFDALVKGNGRLSLNGPLRDLTGPGRPLHDAIAPHLPGARPVRAVAFDKTADDNWTVPWHQDRVIAVADRHDVPGFTNWSRKDGIWHCEPPVEIFRQKRFVRLHLDPQTAETGAMEIAPGSHRSGAVPASDAERIASAGPTELSTAGRGDILILDMLVLHRSRPSTAPARRRVLRIDYAAAELPAPLCWAA